MYIPNHFSETRLEEIERLVSSYPLATLVSHSSQGLEANHIPLIFESKGKEHEKDLLIGHIARKNPLFHGGLEGSEVLVIFQGDNAYISPNWYPTKKEHHRHVPTWNYQVVHMHGTLHFSEDKQLLRRIVSRLTTHHEARTPNNIPWRMGEAPVDYMDLMLSQIVAIEIRVTQILAKSKLSQNRDRVDREGAITALENRGHTQLATAMRETLPSET